MPEKYTVSCPMDCFDLCRFIVTVQDNKIIHIKGDPDHPLTRGLICSKGKKLMNRQVHPHRLLFPLIKENNQFVRASYDQVFDLVAEKLTTIKRDHGNTAILNYTSDGYGGLKNRIQSIFFNTFGGDSRFSGSLCWSAGIAANRYDFGEARGHDPLDVLNSKLVIIWGRNPRDTSIHLQSLLVKARKNGTRVVVIDPIKTATAKHFDQHIQPAPSTDGALALAMAHVLIRENLVDHAFIENHVKGFARFSAHVQKFTPEYAASITGVSADEIWNLAMDYARSEAASIHIGYGMQRYGNGGNNVRCINALAAICGHIGKKGGGVNYASKSLAPLLGTPEKNSEAGVSASRSFPAPCLGSFLEEASDPSIKAAFVAYGNPMVQTPDLSRAMAGFSKVGLRVVFDQFMTDTAAMADIVLPAASVFEQDDIFVTSMYSHTLNFSQKALDPPDTIIPESEFYLELARRMGLDLGFSSSQEYLEQCAGPLLDELKAQGSESITLSDLSGTYPRLKKHDLAWADKQFLTPSGKIEIYSEKAKADGLSPLPEFIPPTDGGDGFPLRLLTCHSRDAMHSQGFLDCEEKPRVRINLATAQKFKVCDGDRVIVVGETGQIEAMVCVDDAIYQNTAFMVQGSWHKSGAVNFLTRERVTDMGNQAAYYDSFCCLHPI